MKLQKETARKLIRDAIISVFIYAFPVVLMFLVFYISGQKPWLKNETRTVQKQIKNQQP